MIAFTLIIILLVTAGLVAGMVRNANIRSRANHIRSSEAARGNHLSRKTSYLAAKAQR
jgi:hypothetical protein